MQTNKTGVDTEHPDDESVERRTALFHKYVYPHRNLIFSLCIRYSYSSADVEDNYSEVLINFFKYIETYDPERPIQTWLHIVTKRFVADMNLKNSQFKRSEDLDVYDVPEHSVNAENVSNNCMGVHNYREYYNDDVLRALDQLKPIYREALLLQQAGYKLHEIMEISYANGNLKSKNMETVKSRIFLAKQQMKLLINRDGEARKD